MEVINFEVNVFQVGFGFGLFLLSVSLPSEGAAINILGFEFVFGKEDEDIRKDLFYMNGEIIPFDISEVGKPVPVHKQKEGQSSLSVIFFINVINFISCCSEPKS